MVKGWISYTMHMSQIKLIERPIRRIRLNTRVVTLPVLSFNKEYDKIKTDITQLFPNVEKR